VEWFGTGWLTTTEYYFKEAFIYMISTKIQDQFIAKVDASKLVNLNYVKDVCERLFKYVQLFNEMPEDNVILWRRPIADIHIINEFASFVLPSSMRIDAADRSWTNLLDMPKCLKESEVKSLTYDDFMNCQIKFRNLFKKSVNDNFSTLADRRKPVNLSDNINYLSVNGKSYNFGDAYVPLPVVKEVGYFDHLNMHWNISSDEILSEFVSKIQF